MGGKNGIEAERLWRLHPHQSRPVDVDAVANDGVDHLQHRNGPIRGPQRLKQTGNHFARDEWPGGVMDQHDISPAACGDRLQPRQQRLTPSSPAMHGTSEVHTPELQAPMRLTYAI